MRTAGSPSQTRLSEPRGLVFMGTPDFARPALSALAKSGETILAVVTQPDRAQGRGRRVAPSPVKTLALDLHLHLWQPETLRDPEVLARFEAARPESIVVVAYGLILPPALLDLPPLGCLNVHASLLPALRGPAPIAWAILRGLALTGVTTMRLDRGVDTGPMLLSRSTPILDTDTAGSLHDRLALLGAELLLETLAGLRTGAITPRPQDEARASYAPLLKKTDGLVDWTRPAAMLSRQVRGLDPWPGAYTLFEGLTLKLFGGRAGSGRGRPGEVLGLGTEGLVVAAGEGSLALAELQLAGYRRLPAADFWRGRRLSPGRLLG
jgi:methionyl-tRNA formyltransferase